MPPYPGEGYPTAPHVVDYLAAYEKRYALPIVRGETVTSVVRDRGGLRVATDTTSWDAAAVISATGTWWRPFLSLVSGEFGGRQLHTVDYDGPAAFAGQRVVVVGGGNSGAQIAADLAPVATVTWVTRRPPRFLPDDVDGRALFDLASRRARALAAGQADPGGVGSLGDIVAVPPVRVARDAGLLTHRPMFARLAADGPMWSDGSRLSVDAVVWCTGFRPTLGHLASLGLRTAGGAIRTEGTRAVDEPRLHLLGYGDWTGPGSATLAAVGPTARAAVSEIARQADPDGRAGS